MKSRKTVLNEAVGRFEMPAYEQIPDVGLYLEQVARFINSFLTDFPEMNVTTSMISNYAKQKLIDRVNRKTYTRDQIAALIMIALSKSVISIDHVRLMLEEFRRNSESLENAYRMFSASLTEVLAALNSDSAYKPAAAADDTDKLIRNIVIAIAHKMYLERCFDSLGGTQ